MLLNEDSYRGDSIRVPFNKNKGQTKSKKSTQSDYYEFVTNADQNSIVSSAGHNTIVSGKRNNFSKRSSSSAANLENRFVKAL